MQSLPNLWIDGLTTFDQVLDVIDLSLTTLKDNAVSADFTDSATKTQYSNDVMYMKQFFERAEFLSRSSM